MAKVKVKRERFSRSRSVSSSSTNRSGSSSPSPAQKAVAVTQKVSAARKTFKKSSDNNISVNSTASPKQTKHLHSRYESTLSPYLAKSQHLKVLTANRNPPALTRQDIGTEDEVWLFQCPQTVDVEKLVGTKLKLNSQQHLVPADETTKYEYHSSPANTQFYTVISKSADKNKHEAYSFRAAGVVRIQHEIPEVVPCDVFNAVDARVPYPENLKVRHPILGFDFEKTSTLSKSVRRSLRKAVIASNIAKAESLVKEEERSSSSKTRKKRSSSNIEFDYDAIMGLNEDSLKTESKTGDLEEMEVPKRKKRKLEAVSNDEEESPRKKHKSKRIKLEDGLAEDLGWISIL